VDHCVQPPSTVQTLQMIIYLNRCPEILYKIYCLPVVMTAELTNSIICHGIRVFDKCEVNAVW